MSDSVDPLIAECAKYENGEPSEFVEGIIMGFLSRKPIDEVAATLQIKKSTIEKVVKKVQEEAAKKANK